MKRHSSLADLTQKADASTRAVFIFDKNANFLHFNDAWLHWRGAALEEERETSPVQFIHPDDLSDFMTRLVLVHLEHEPSLCECRLLRCDGTSAWFRFIITPVLSPRGVFVAGMACGQVIDAQKAGEEDARRFSAVFASMETGIIIKDREGRITDWSPGATSIMGYTAEEMLGQTSDLYTHSPNLQVIAEVNSQLAVGRHTSFIRTEVLHKDGRLIICSTSFSPIVGPQGDVTGSVVIFHDVTAKKLAEQKRLEAEDALQRSHKDIEGILNEIPAPLCVVHAESGTILGCNPAFADMCATTEAAVLNQSLSRFFQIEEESGQTGTEIFFSRLCADAAFVCRLKKSDGTVAAVELMGRPFAYNDQNSLAVHCIDLTRRRKQEQALREAVLAAEDASKMKSTFLANMSHEIRTPLNGVIGFAELALDEPGVSGTVSDYLNKIKISANGLLEIINDVLDISKIEAGKIDLEKAPFDLHTDIMEACETIIGARAKEKNVVLYLYSEPMVHRKLVGDQTRLRQILFNLLSNAVKFTNVGIVKLMLNVETLRDDNCTIYFEIKDSGIGMPPEQIACIFEPFSQGDSSTTRKYGGTGLGLTITKNLIELMGGELKVESAVGIGSKFSFTLTFETITDNTRFNLQTVAAAPLREKPLFSGEVLVCEDNTINQQVIEEHLSRVGLNPTLAANGKLGVELVKNRLREGRPFDLILMDIHMPVMDGLEATQKLQELGVRTPIIALTANAMSTDRKRYLGQGMADYLAKPFKAHELWECLLRHLHPVAAPAPESAFRQAAAPESAQTQPATACVIDRRLGIENAAGNEALYRRLLVNFVHDNADARQRLAELIERGDIQPAHRIAHTIKSVAGTIGAMELSEAARQLESVLAEENLSVAEACLPGFSVALDTVLKALADADVRKSSDVSASAPGAASVTASALTSASTSAAASAETGDTRRVEELLARLEPLLQNADSECLEYMSAIETLLVPLNAEGRTLAGQIDDYDFDLALDTLHAIKAGLEHES